MVGLSLAMVSAACGLLALWVFLRTTDLAAVRTTIKRVHAHLLEFRLFYDEPLLVWQAQKAVVRENLRFLLLILRPAIILLIPMWWLLIQLDAIYGYAPLPIDQASVITAQMTGPIAPEEAPPVLQMPPEISVENPPVRSISDRQISWRIRPLHPVRGKMQLTLHNLAIDKSIAAGSRPIFLVRKRGRSLLDLLLHPEEPVLPAAGLDWIEVDYPTTKVSIAGVTLPWMAWFVLISTSSALLFARLFRFSK